MSEIKVLTIEDNEEFLRQVSIPVTFPDSSLLDNVRLLDEFFNQNETTLALASVQIGIPKRLIYLRNTDLESVKRKNNDIETSEDKTHNERKVLVNPKILSREGLTDYWENCASCMDNMGHVKRPYKIVLEYQDVNGEFHQETFEGFPSTVLSHELDHLDGILHMDVADEVIVMPLEQRKEFRKTHWYNVVSKDGNYEELLKKINK